MTRVRTLQWHRNVHGEHNRGDEYNHDRPATDIQFGYVEEVTAETESFEPFQPFGDEEGEAEPE
ncbi:hypothetical protein CMI47_05520 [Candidatus Pacearchaeota archaeon]|jgi:hypothetical protein|nr:hypothetical protein [Candidatus Pacearchaeota archaeon]|tara:strand:- start:1015 stop:1206 length:192 start_codon:yes stop_codon:yes gene_type:complete